MLLFSVQPCGDAKATGTPTTNKKDSAINANNVNWKRRVINYILKLIRICSNLTLKPGSHWSEFRFRGLRAGGQSAVVNCLILLLCYRSFALPRNSQDYPLNPRSIPISFHLTCLLNCVVYAANKQRPLSLVFCFTKKLTRKQRHNKFCRRATEASGELLKAAALNMEWACSSELCLLPSKTLRFYYYNNSIANLTSQEVPSCFIRIWFKRTAMAGMNAKWSKTFGIGMQIKALWGRQENRSD